MRVRLCLLLAATLAASVSAQQSEDVLGGLKSSVQSWLGLMRGELEHHQGAYAAYMSIRYIVPPGEARKFEDRWLDFEKDVMKHEKGMDVFDLKKHTLDNLIYLGYGEWRSHQEVHDHVTSRHFEDFADWVDDHGIRWEIQILKNLSEDVEDEEQGRHMEVNQEQDTMVGRRKHREQPEQDEQDEQRSVSRKLLEEEGGELDSHRRSRKKGHSKQQKEDMDWDKYVPKEYRKYIPKSVRPSCQKDKSKRHHRKNELSEAVLASLPNNGLDADDTTVLDLWKEVARSSNLHHVLITYIVPPGEGKGFTDAWLDTAEKTVKEKNNRIYSLRKVATDNTRFYGYGTWDSMGDFMDHFESGHVSRLIDYTADKDITWFVTPLTKIGHQRE